jgi:hypothetical protein
MSTTNLGEGAAAQQAVNNTNTGSTVAGIQAKAGVGIGEAYQNQYNAYGNIGTGIASAARGGVGDWTNYSLYNPILQNMVKMYGGGGGGYRDASSDFSSNTSVFSK